MVDVESLMAQHARCSQPAEWDEAYGNWKYRLAGMVDEKRMELIVALDPSEDYTTSPLAIFITVYERKA